MRKGAKFCPLCNVANFLENRKPMAPRKKPKKQVDYKEARIKYLKEQLSEVERFATTILEENIALRNRIRELTNEKTTR